MTLQDITTRRRTAWFTRTIPGLIPTHFYQTFFTFTLCAFSFFVPKCFCRLASFQQGDVFISRGAGAASALSWLGVGGLMRRLVVLLLVSAFNTKVKIIALVPFCLFCCD
jgi:hypothetical protein